jgi:hypothetical protein
MIGYAYTANSKLRLIDYFSEVEETPLAMVYTGERGYRLIKCICEVAFKKGESKTIYIEDVDKLHRDFKTSIQRFAELSKIAKVDLINGVGTILEFSELLLKKLEDAKVKQPDSKDLAIRALLLMGVKKREIDQLLELKPSEVNKVKNRLVATGDLECKLDKLTDAEYYTEALTGRDYRVQARVWHAAYLARGQTATRKRVFSDSALARKRRKQLWAGEDYLKRTTMYQKL